MSDTSDNDTSGKALLSEPKIRYAKAVLKEMGVVPAKARTAIQNSLTMVLKGIPPALDCEKLTSAGDDVFELKVRGRPTFRCMYAIDKNGDVVVLHVTDKATSGQDNHLVKTTVLRYKRLMTGR